MWSDGGGLDVGARVLTPRGFGYIRRVLLDTPPHRGYLVRHDDERVGDMEFTRSDITERRDDPVFAVGDRVQSLITGRVGTITEVVVTYTLVFGRRMVTLRIHGDGEVDTLHRTTSDQVRLVGKQGVRVVSYGVPTETDLQESHFSKVG